MNLSSQLSTAIITTAIAIISSQATVALTPVEVNNIARKITVRISGPQPGGTGIIVNQQRSTYTVVTNWHVVKTTGTYTIQTQNGSYEVKPSQIRRLPGVDLAVLEFDSNQTYEAASIGDSSQIKEGTTVHAAGWMTPSASCQESRCYSFSTGVINRILNSPKDGYGWVYSNQTRPGMSGGPVLDEEGRLVGINGRAKTSPDSPGADYLAIPINTVVKLVPEIASSPSSSQISNNSLRQQCQQGNFPKTIINPKETYLEGELITVKFANACPGKTFFVIKPAGSNHGLNTGLFRRSELVNEQKGEVTFHKDRKTAGRYEIQAYYTPDKRNSYISGKSRSFDVISRL